MDVLTCIRNRRSVREFAQRPIPDDVMDHLMEALRLAPSACNYQPWKFVIVTDETLRGQIAEAARKQKFIATAPIIVVGIGFPGAAYKKMGGDGSSIDIDLAIAFDHLALAAAADGLGTCWIGAFEQEAVKKLLNAPKESKVVAIMPVGYPARPELMGPAPAERRKKEWEVFVEEKFPA